MAKILFIEDDEDYRTTIKEILEAGNHEVVSVENPIDALEIFQEDSFDLVISDYMLDSMNGIQLIKYLKRVDAKVKTIILTGIDSPDVEISALDTSVDQFLQKGVRGDILTKYVDRVLQSPIKVFANQNEQILQSVRENITVHLDSYEVYKDGHKIELTFKEYQLLVFFMENMGKVLTREEIIDEVWGENKEEITLRVVDTQVKLLRKKLNLKIIYTIRNVGYRWNE